jgi:hypothetical protein
VEPISGSTVPFQRSHWLSIVKKSCRDRCGFAQNVKIWSIDMKNLMSITLAVALATSSIVVASGPAMAEKRHHYQDRAACMTNEDVGGLIVLGVVLGAVTGGVANALFYGGAYAVGGAAIGGGSGLALGAVSDGHHNCV